MQLLGNTYHDRAGCPNEGCKFRNPLSLEGQAHSPLLISLPSGPHARPRGHGFLPPQGPVKQDANALHQILSTGICYKCVTVRASIMKYQDHDLGLFIWLFLSIGGSFLWV